ncbi:MAG TPA: hypothetical protein VL096_17645 [Pirellulaceae bacterium]|nr:hypothetical protein [Pirellulaceae bacterium]
MSTKANCPQCQCEIRIPSDYGGRSVKCPQCLQRFLVPLVTTSAPSFETLVQQALSDEETQAREVVCANCETKQLPGPYCVHCRAPLPAE